MRWFSERGHDRWTPQNPQMNVRVSSVSNDQGAGADFYLGGHLYYKHLVASALSLSTKLKLLVILAKRKLKTHLVYYSGDIFLMFL